MSTAVAPHHFDAVLHKANAWVSEVARELGVEDKHVGYRALRAVLQALRDRLTVEEACQLAAQLPMLVRGIYFEGYSPAGKPLTQRTEEAFLDAVRGHYGAGPLDVRTAACAVFKVVAHHVSPGEVEDVKHILPQALRALWPQQGAAVLYMEAPPAPPAPVPAPGPDLSAIQGAVGAPVKDLVGEKLGVVQDVVLDAASGQARFAVIGFGGFLGLGEHLLPIPWKLLHWREGDGSFQLLLHTVKKTLGDLHHAPKVHHSQWRPSSLDAGLQSAVHGFYGTKPL